MVADALLSLLDPGAHPGIHCGVGHFFLSTDACVSTGFSGHSHIQLDNCESTGSISWACFKELRDDHITRPSSAYHQLLSVGCATACGIPKYLIPGVALQLTNTSVCGGSCMRLATFSLAELALIFAGIHCIFCSPIVKSFWCSDRSQLCAAKKSAPIIKLGLSFLALTTTVALYTPSPIPTPTVVWPKVGTGLLPTPSSHGVSCV